MARNQSTGLNSADALSDLSRDSEVVVPDGIVLDTDEEMLLWKQFTGVRVSKDWRPFDLILVAKAVKLEARIREYERKLELEGPVSESQRGTPVLNPVLTAIQSQQSQLLRVTAALGLTQTTIDPRTKADRGKKKASLDAAMDDDDGLIARPSVAH